jgi:hypothetical protein
LREIKIRRGRVRRTAEGKPGFDLWDGHMTTSFGSFLLQNTLSLWKGLGTSQGEKPLTPRCEHYDEAGGNSDGRVEPCGDDGDDIANEARGLGNRHHAPDEVGADGFDAPNCLNDKAHQPGLPSV